MNTEKVSRYWGCSTDRLYFLRVRDAEWLLSPSGSLIFIVPPFISGASSALPTNTSGDKSHCPQWITLHESLLLYSNRALNRQGWRGCSLVNVSESFYSCWRGQTFITVYIILCCNSRIYPNVQVGNMIYMVRWYKFVNRQFSLYHLWVY